MVIKWGLNAKPGAILPENEKFEQPPPVLLVFVNAAVLAIAGRVREETIVRLSFVGATWHKSNLVHLSL